MQDVSQYLHATTHTKAKKETGNKNLMTKIKKNLRDDYTRSSSACKTGKTFHSVTKALQ